MHARIAGKLVAVVVVLLALLSAINMLKPYVDGVMEAHLLRFRERDMANIKANWKCIDVVEAN